VHPVPAGAGAAVLEVPGDAPDWLPRWHDRDADRAGRHQLVVPDSAAALAYLAELGAVELHPWISTVDDPDAPTWALFDIEPGPREGVAAALEVARLHRTALAHLGVEGRPVLTGARGIQIWVPVGRGTTFARTRRWVDAVAQAIGATVPDLVDRGSGGARRGRHAHLDTAPNAPEQRLVAPFGPRQAPGAPVAVPIGWDELDDDRLRPDRWTIRNVGDRVRRAGDPLAPLIGIQQRLPAL
jgi:bifunctional non-homologous end joining protein LigD